MSFDTLVEQSFKLQFQAEMALAAQQLKSKLRQHVIEKMCSGKATTASDIINKGGYTRRTGRLRSNLETPAEFVRRWLVMRDPIASGQYLDDEDMYRQMGNHQSELIQHHVANVERGIDDIILGLDEGGAIANGGIMGKISEGETPGGATVLPSSQIVVHGGVGLTLAKMMTVRENFAKADYDLDRETPNMAVDPRQMTNLLEIVASASGNLNALDQAVLVEGKVTRFMRINFLEINRLPLVGGVRSCPSWMKSNIVLGVWQDTKPDLYNDTHADNTPYMKQDCRMDATRKQDSGVQIIECTE